MAAVPGLNGSDRFVEKRILALLRERPQWTFTSLADAIPDHPWRVLFRALGQLQEQQQVKLSPLPWDYEILLQSSIRSAKDKRRAQV